MIEILNADAKSIPLADNSVQCCITSPPYYGLRKYIEDGDPLKKFEVGLERTPQEYVDGLVSVFREVWRVCNSSATVWLNLGDSYASDTKGTGGKSSNLESGKATQHTAQYGARKFDHGLKSKDMVGIPWRVAFALQADGWYLRSDIIWHKPNPMPESVTDRPTKAHEYIFLLSKSQRYFYDAEAIAEPVTCPDPRMVDGFVPKSSNGKHKGDKQSSEFRKQDNTGNRTYTGFNDRYEPRETRNRRTVWTVATSPYSGAHFATFPPALVEPMILAGSRPGDLVLDPFAGTATVGRVAIKHQRRFVGLELNPAYIELAEERTSNVQVQMIWP